MTRARVTFVCSWQSTNNESTLTVDLLGVYRIKPISVSSRILRSIKAKIRAILRTDGLSL